MLHSLVVAVVAGVDAVPNLSRSHILVTFLCLVAGFFSGFGLLVVASHARSKDAPARAISREFDAPLEGRPVVGQEAIDLAMNFYKISKPADANQPVFDPELKDRGLTVKSSWFGKTQVYIGPSAFANWAMLGSTLAHEVEVHCRQNFPMIFIKDRLGLDGTSDAEREAYRYEISNASRFGLSGRDAGLIAATVEYYYPRGK